MAWGFVAFWAFWLVAFGVVEYVAIKKKGRGDTLSETVWWSFEKGRIGGIPVVKWFAFGLFVWLFLHFFFPGLDVWMWE